MKHFSIVKFVFVCFFVAFLSACATAKAPLPLVEVSNVSHGDFKYSGEYLELPGEMRWINGIPYPYYTAFTPEFTATLALVMAKRPELFERQKKPDPEFASRCKSDLNNLVSSLDFLDSVWNNSKDYQLVIRCLRYVANEGASYVKPKRLGIAASAYPELLGIQFKIVDEDGNVLEMFHGNLPPDNSG